MNLGRMLGCPLILDFRIVPLICCLSVKSDKCNYLTDKHLHCILTAVVPHENIALLVAI